MTHHRLDQEQWRHLNRDALHGWEIVDGAARLCVMNLYLHGIGHDLLASPIRVDDSLASDPGDRFDLVLTNPPFGKKSSVTFVTDQGELKREAADHRARRLLGLHQQQAVELRPAHQDHPRRSAGTAAVVVPDNVLFEGGAGETVRRKLLHECDVHTLLRLPTGIFYAQGVKANVLFFDRRTGGERAQTQRLWIYDLRTNMQFHPQAEPAHPRRSRRLRRAATTRPTATSAPPPGRRRRRTVAGAASPSTNCWRGTRSTWTSSGCAMRAWRIRQPARPDLIAAEIVEDLRAALEQFEEVLAELAPATDNDEEVVDYPLRR